MKLKVKYLALLSLILLIYSSLESQIITTYDQTKKTDYTHIPFQKDNLLGFVNRESAVIIQPAYDAVSFFNEDGFAQVKKAGLYGIIDTQGNLVVPPMSNRDISYSLVLNYNDSYEIIKDLYYVANRQSNEWMLFAPGQKEFKSKVYKDHKSTYFDNLPFEFKEILKFKGYHFGYHRIVNAEGKVNFIDTLFNEVLPNYIEDGFPLNQNYFSAFDANGSIGVINRKGEYISNQKYESIKSSPIPDIFLISAGKEQKLSRRMGLLHENGEILVDTMYHSLWHSFNEFFIAHLNKQKGVIDQNGKIIIPLDNQLIYKYADRLFIVGKGGQSFIYNEAGKLVSGPFPSISYPQSKHFCTSIRNDSTLIIDKNGSVIRKLQGVYKFESEYEDIVCFRHNNLLGLLNLQGEIILPFNFNKISPIQFDNIFIIENDQGQGLFSESEGMMYDLGLHNLYFEYRSAFNKEGILQVSNDGEIIRYTGSMSNYEIEKRNELKIASFSSKIDGDNRVITLESGQTFSYPANNSYKILTNDKEFFVYKKQSEGLVMYTTEMKPLFAKEQVVLRWFDYKGSFLFFVKEISNRKKRYFLVNTKGEIIKDFGLKIVRRVGEKFWAVGEPNASKLLDNEFNSISEDIYESIWHKSGFIFARNNVNNTLSIYDEQSNLLQNDIYSKVQKLHEEYFILEKSITGNLETCILDTLLNEMGCYTYAKIIPVEGLEDFLIVADLYDYGIISRKDELIVPCEYNAINYFEELDMFELIKGEKSQLIRSDNTLVIDNIKGSTTLKNVGESGFYIEGREFTYFFDVSGNYLIKFNRSLGRYMADEILFNNGLVKFNDTGNFTFAEISSGLIYK